MNISAIETFLAVYRLRNLNRAAEELNVTQSAVTARLDTLESALGARLINRSRKGATLTKAGYAFLEQASLITRSWSTARARATFPQDVETLFSFVCDPGIWDGLGRDLVDRWRRDHPENALEVWTARHDEASQWLTSGLSDAALMVEPLSGADLAHRELEEQRLVQVSTEPREAVAWDPAYVFVDYGLAFRDWHAETWPADQTARISFSNPSWALEHLLRNGGSAYLPEHLLSDHEASGRLFRVGNAPRFTRKLYLTWRKQVEPQFAFLRSSPG